MSRFSRPSIQKRQAALQQMPITGFIAAQFHAQTDAAGRFTLTGLPAGSFIQLKPGAGLLMADGSMGAIKIQAGGLQDAGLLTAVRPGQIKIHLVDKQTNKPLVNGAMTAIFPVNMIADVCAVRRKWRRSAVRCDDERAGRMPYLKICDRAITKSSWKAAAYSGSCGRGSSRAADSNNLAAGNAARAPPGLAGQAACPRGGDDVHGNASQSDYGEFAWPFRTRGTADH